jgi:hypothetical protein
MSKFPNGGEHFCGMEYDMAQRTAIGGFGGDWENWAALLGLLVTLGIAPKTWRPALGTIGGALTIYKILKGLGWL